MRLANNALQRAALRATAEGKREASDFPPWHSVAVSYFSSAKNSSNDTYALQCIAKP